MSVRCCLLTLWALVCLVLVPFAAADEAVPADRAYLEVRVPVGAQLAIETTPTQQTGAERLFMSPTLQAGRKFYYTVVATWTEGGATRTLEREVEVWAGHRSVVDFGKPGATPQPAPSTAARAPAKLEPEPKPAREAKAATPAAAKSRSFQFTYGATVTGLKPGELARIWLPVASSSKDQDVTLEFRDLPGEGKNGREKEYGNEILYVEARAKADGTIPLSVTYRVTRREVKGDGSGMVEEDAAKLARFLQADAKVPISGRPLDLLHERELPDDQLDAARVMYNIVNNHMRYSKDKPGWGQGDAVWACDSKFGNCSDFHSLFISLARSQKIPAKFEIGFPIPEKRGTGDVAGYHCWAKFRPNGKGWVPVDISEANKNPALKEYYFGNLTEDRVTFSVGRDLELVPKQDGPPVNFLIYPYVEVNGKPYDAAKIQKKFSYADVPATK